MLYIGSFSFDIKDSAKAKRKQECTEGIFNLLVEAKNSEEAFVRFKSYLLDICEEDTFKDVTTVYLDHTIEINGILNTPVVANFREYFGGSSLSSISCALPSESIPNNISSYRPHVKGDEPHIFAVLCKSKDKRCLHEH